MRINTQLREEFSRGEAELTSRDRALGFVEGALGRVIASTTELEEYSARSYVHPNGFSRLKLPFDAPYGGVLFLNVWQPSSAAA